MEKTININRCINECPFFESTMDGMQCGHPYWEGKEAYDNMIITWDNGGHGKIPPLCPLKQENLTVKYQLTLGK